MLNRKRRDSWRPTVEGAMAVHEKPAVIDDLDRGERRYLEMPFVRSLLAALAGLLTTTLPVLLVGALGVQLKRDLGFGDASLGLAISLFWISVAACALLAGHYVDRIGWRRGLWTTSIVSAIALAGIAFLSDSWMTLAILLCLAGASNALAMPTTNVLLAVAVPPPHRALAFGIKQAASPASLFLAGLAVPFVALTLGWRWVFVAALVFPLSAVALAGSRSAAPTRKVHRPDAMSVVRGRLSPALLVLTMAGGLGAAVATALTGFLVSSSVAAGVGEAAAGFLLAAASVCGVSVRVLAGWFVGRAGSDGLRPVAGLMAVGAGGLLLLATHQPALIVPGALVAFAAAWGWPGLFYYSITMANLDTPGRATGVAHLGISLGGIVGGVTFGMALESFGYVAAWRGLVAVMLLAAILVVEATRLPRSPRRSPPGAGHRITRRR